MVKIRNNQKNEGDDYTISPFLKWVRLGMTKRVSSFIRAYIQALIETAGKQSTLKAVYNSIQELEKVLHTYPNLSRSLNNKYIPIEKRDALALDLGKHLKLHTHIINFLRLLVRNNHVHLFRIIAARVKPSLERDLGIIQAAIISARPLSKEQFQRLSQWLDQRTPLKPNITSALDASLLGGTILEYGAYRLDASLRTQIHRLHMTLKGSF